MSPLLGAGAGGGYHEWDVLATEMPQFWKVRKSTALVIYCIKLNPPLSPSR
jgi:hypothetical protein